MHQVVTIGADGSVQGLQVKPGKGMDLRQFGRAAIVRASEIVFDPDAQRWVVHVMDKAVVAHMHGHARLQLGAYTDATGHAYPSKPYILGIDRVLYFDEYEDAVSVEIETLDALRKVGVYDRP